MRTGAKEKGLGLSPVEDFNSITGMGVQGRIAGKMVLVGNLRLLAENKVAAEEISSIEKDLQLKGHGVMLVDIDGQAAGVVSVIDPIK